MTASVTVTSNDLNTCQSNVSATTMMSAETTTEMVTMKATMIHTSEGVKARRTRDRSIQHDNARTRIKLLSQHFSGVSTLKPALTLISRAAEHSTYVDVLDEIVEDVSNWIRILIWYESVSSAIF